MTITASDEAVSLSLRVSLRADACQFLIDLFGGDVQLAESWIVATEAQGDPGLPTQQELEFLIIGDRDRRDRTMANLQFLLRHDTPSVGYKLPFPLFAETIEQADREIAKLILGQNLSSRLVGSSVPGAEAHQAELLSWAIKHPTDGQPGTARYTIAVAGEAPARSRRSLAVRKERRRKRKQRRRS